MTSATGYAAPRGPRTSAGGTARRGELPGARPSVVDPARVRRALTLDVERLQERVWRVTGGAEPHVVRGASCDCADAYFQRRGACKHVLAVHLHHRLDPRVLEALRTAVTSEESS